MKRIRERTKRILCGALALLSLAGMAWLLLDNGVILLNQPSDSGYPVRGVDVSKYQGEIDWDVLAAQNLRFAFVKATEGSATVDECFAANVAGARESGLRVGAYHFFSFDSPGETQADNYIRTVEKLDGMLPPVIDVELYGKWKKNPPEASTVRAELNTLIARLKAHCGKMPILYATGRSYALYISGQYPDCDIWIRNVYTKPELPDGRAWTFWQYVDRGQLPCYDGEERFIDLNVFCGTEAEFLQYAR